VTLRDLKDAATAMFERNQDDPEAALLDEAASVQDLLDRISEHGYDAESLINSMID
jgi:hypothetical protein